MAIPDEINVSPSKTLTILGCGTLGSAILYGLLTSLRGTVSSNTKDETNGIGEPYGKRPSNEMGGLQKPTHFIACVQSAKSAQRLKQDLSTVPGSGRVTVLHADNLEGVRRADSILLACQPKDIVTCLNPPAIQSALKGKLLVSILAGVTIPQIEAMLRPSIDLARPHDGKLASDMTTTTIVRAMPNTASFARASTTAITSSPSTQASDLEYTAHLFRTIGTVTHVPIEHFDICTALCGSSPAFFALFLDSLLDGAVALGLKRSDAQVMAAETMRGTATLILAGEAPEKVRETVATPGGSTIQGLLALEKNALRATVAEALIKCSRAASGLGQD